MTIKNVQEESDFPNFTLPGLLPKGYSLAFNQRLGTLSLLRLTDEKPELLAQQQFTNSEVCVLIPLLESFPYFCPYEVLLASFNTGSVTQATIDKARERLHQASEDGTWDQEMRPVRNVLSRVRLKLYCMGFDVIVSEKRNGRFAVRNIFGVS